MDGDVERDMMRCHDNGYDVGASGLLAGATEGGIGSPDSGAHSNS